MQHWSHWKFVRQVLSTNKNFEAVRCPPKPYEDLRRATKTYEELQKYAKDYAGLRSATKTYGGQKAQNFPLLGRFGRPKRAQSDPWGPWAAHLGFVQASGKFLVSFIKLFRNFEGAEAAQGGPRDAQGRPGSAKEPKKAAQETPS